MTSLTTVAGTYGTIAVQILAIISTSLGDFGKAKEEGQEGLIKFFEYFQQRTLLFYPNFLPKIPESMYENTSEMLFDAK